jgi:phosphoribosylformylglycinamidine synthase
LLQSPNIASKEWVYSQYDHSVQINTVVRPGHGDAAVLRIRESKSNKGIAVKADCNSRYCYLDPLWGAQSRLLSARATRICVGCGPRRRDPTACALATRKSPTASGSSALD